MKKKAIICFLVGLMTVLATGCNGNRTTNSNGETKNPLDDFLDLDPVVTDRVIIGEAVNDIESLFDITGKITEKEYDIIDSHPYSEDEIMVLYSGTSDSLIRIYNIGNGKVAKEIRLKDTILSKDADLNVVSESFSYIVEHFGEKLIYVNVKVSEYTEVVMDKTPESMLVVGEGDVVYYTIKDDCNIYQYVKDTGKSFSAFDATDMVDSISLKYMVSGGNTFIVNVSSEGYSGYALVSLENQELEPLEIVEGEFYYDGSEYVYSAVENIAALYIYDPMTPRLKTEFRLDQPEETRDVRLCRYSSCFLTLCKETSGDKLRFYNLTEGVLENVLELSQFETKETHDFPDSPIVMISCLDRDGAKKVLIWNTEIIEKIIE